MIESRKILAVGSEGTGKTALLISYSSNTFPPEHVPTIFDNYTAGTEYKGKNILVNIWDTAGLDEYSHLRLLSYADTDVFLICFDVGNRTSFDAVHSWYTEIKFYVPESKVILVANKIDIRKHDPTAVTTSEGRRMAGKINADYAECSALLKQGITQVFDSALRLTVGDSYKQRPLKHFVRKHTCAVS
jgi:small GTP-binding protein